MSPTITLVQPGLAGLSLGWFVKVMLMGMAGGDKCFSCESPVQTQ